ncbi:hypothetical protein BCR44DRAFT_1501015 [Catenaria anguillulae PL171]|uniref:Uncharacterized protein n=1 Tax=Catenaria anguillulae PL171 TaxID=765915 RepID=A0A1Y2HIM5_9FUNG|nr:hypothetical protein BCR44DRAFT_1501015 [Catenaria anguillulae PL171]
MPSPAPSPQQATRARLPTIFTRQGTTSLKNALLIATLGYSSVYATTKIVGWTLGKTAAYLPTFLASSAKWPSLVSLARLSSSQKVSVWSALKPCVAVGGRLMGRLTGGVAVGLCWLVPGIDVDEFSIMIEDLPSVDEDEDEGQGDQGVDEDDDVGGDGVEYQVGFDEMLVE